MELLRVDNFSLTYDGRTNAADHVSFSVKEGEVVCIVGESGSGKSTVLHGILGITPQGAATKGDIVLFGTPCSAMTQEELRRIRGEKVGMIFQDTGRYLNPISRVGKQFDFFLKQHGIKDREKLRTLEEEMLRRVQLGDPARILKSYPFELSGGMRQRIGIAMAMSLKPKLLLADEPTSALDVTVQAQVVKQMMDLRRQNDASLLMVTHNMGVAAFMADKIGVMQHGRLVEWGTAEQIIYCPATPYTRALLSSVIGLTDKRIKESLSA